MEEQLPLFESATRRWVERLWERAGPERRDEVVSVLAEMARTTLTPPRRAPRAKEADDE